jgi:hypothetical protein
MGDQIVQEIDDPRRRLLIEALTLGVFSAAVPGGIAWAQAFSSTPTKLPPGQSIYRITGTVTVNGKPANLQTPVQPGDTVETGKDSEIVFVVGGHSMILRTESRLTIEGDKAASSLLISGLRLLTGKLLSVSRNTSMKVSTATATIGIRGTGWYAESDPEQTYFCTCYGSADISASNDPASTERIVSTHHDRPLYILAKAAQGASIRNAPWKNHSDQELLLIETLVGRAPPFSYEKKEYRPPPRDY